MHGTVRERSDLSNLAEVKDRITLHTVDVTDAPAVDRLVGENFNVIHHLAAITYIPTSWAIPGEVLDTNARGTLNILESLRNRKLQTVMHLAGTCEEYGRVEQHELPVKETNPLRPTSPYAVSKVAADMLCQIYHGAHHVRTVITRAFNHSVAEWTPVIVRDETGLVDIRPISRVRRPPPRVFGEDMKDKALFWRPRDNLGYGGNIDVWSNPGFSRAFAMSAHPVDEKLRLIVTGASIFAVTTNHSIIGPRLEPIEAGTIRLGDMVGGVDQFPNSEACEVDEEIAWLLGFFVAEGWAGSREGGERQRSNPGISISNNDPELLEKARKIMLRHFGIQGRIWPDGEKLQKLLPSRRMKWLGWFLRENCYLPDGQKRIPKFVLNAQGKAKTAFLRGYNDGDGLKKGHGDYEFKSFKTRSPTLAMGLCYLIRNTTRQQWTLNMEERSGRLYWQINLQSPIRGHEHWGAHLEKEPRTVKKILDIPYNGWVYDFSTQSEMFHGGIGDGLLHNTGARRGKSFLTSTVVRQAAEIAHGLRQSFSLGNVQAVRDWTDVHDVRAAYVAAVNGWARSSPSGGRIEFGRPYNVCSGVGHSVRQLVDMVAEYADIPARIVTDQSKIRPLENPALVGDNTLFVKATGWKPLAPLQTVLKTMLDEEMRRLDGEKP